MNKIKNSYLIISFFVMLANSLPLVAQNQAPPGNANPDTLDGQKALTQYYKSLPFTGMTGSLLSTEEAAAQSDIIFVGQITAIGKPLGKAPGQSTYHRVPTMISQILRGSIASPVFVDVSVRFHPGKIKEAPPETGTPYIFFVHTLNGLNRVLKILPATDANITKIKALIAAAPAGK